MTDSGLHSMQCCVPRLFVLAVAALMCVTVARAAEPEKSKQADAAAAPTYGQELEFLGKHTRVIELSNGHGARIAICPQWQGRVMTSTSGDLAGPSFGWINREFITAGKPSAIFNNYGGEDRFWLAPEGGPFSLWFAAGSEQTLPNWLTPKDLNEGAFEVTQPSRLTYRMKRNAKFTNSSKTSFELEVTREIRLRPTVQFAEQIDGLDAATVRSAKGLRMVGFGSSNTITNRGPAMKRDSGLVSLWILGQFPAGDQTVIVVPYRAGDEKELGPVVNANYFGDVPADRLKVTPTAILFRGDGKYRAKLGTSAKRAKPVAGSIDFRTGVLTLVHYTMPADPAAAMYLNNTWQAKQDKPFAGDAFNSYNDGPPEPGAPALGGFYELETLAPAIELANGKSSTHVHSTSHFQGDIAALAAVAKAALGVDLEEVRKMVAP